MRMSGHKHRFGAQEVSWLLAAAFGLCVLAVGMLGCGGRQGEKGQPSHIFDLAKPATVCVIAVYRAQLSVPEAVIPADRLSRLRQRLIAMAQAGELNASDENAVRTAAVEEIIDNIFDYVMPSSSKRTFEKGIQAQGSAWFVTPDGYLVTNAHVVYADEDELKLQFAKNVLSELIEQDVKDFKDEVGGAVSDELTARLVEAATRWYVRYLEMSDLDKLYLALPGVAVGGEDAEEKGLSAEIVKMGEPMPGKDVAILKVEASNLPTLPLGDDAALKTGDPIYAIGYPGKATFAPWYKQTEKIEPSFTSGVVSSRKKMQGGWDAIQTDVSVTHGNSGGPALDASGRVVGIVTWGAVEETETASGETQAREIPGMNFLVPVSVIKDFLQQANVVPTEGQVTVLYRQAVDKMAVHHYKAALKYLSRIKGLAPETPWIDEYLATCNSEIAAGKDKTWQEWAPWFLLVGIIIVALVAVAVMLATRGSRARKQPPGGYLAAPGQAPPPVYPPAPASGQAPVPPAQPAPPVQPPPPAVAPPAPPAPAPQAAPEQPQPPAAAPEPPRPPMPPPPPPPPRPG